MAIIEAIFHAKYRAGQRVVAFEREDIVRFASRLNIRLPKNLGDVDDRARNGSSRDG